MPRIREYAGFGNQNADSEGESQQRERVYRLPEVTTADLPQEQEETSTKTEGAKVGNAKSDTAADKTSTAEMLVITETDLTPKYTEEQSAINSIAQDGAFYEDYLRGEKGELFKSKEFVLTAIAQHYDRFYAPQTPKTADWIDELYLTERTSFLFEQTRESTKEDEIAAFATELYCYLRKSAFSSQAYQTVDGILKRVAKVAAAQVLSSEDAERMRASLTRFQSAVNSAMMQVKEKHNVALAAKTVRKEKLIEDKKQLAGIVDDMKFEF